MLYVPISPLPFSLPVLVRFLRPGLQSWSGSAIYNWVSPHLECLPVWFIIVWFGVEFSICYRSPSMVKVAEPSKPMTSSLFASYNIMLKRCPDSLQGVSPANTSCVISSFCLGATVWKLSCNLARWRRSEKNLFYKLLEVLTSPEMSDLLIVRASFALAFLCFYSRNAMTLSAWAFFYSSIRLLVRPVSWT